MCYLPIHFANCSFGYLIFRRLGVSVPLSIGGIGLYSVLWTTAGTVTYLGEASEVLCLFFLLGSTLAFLSKKRGATTLSAVLFLVAMRTKEFAIMTPAVFGALALFLAPPSSARQTLLWIVRRLWMHLVIGLVFGMAYLSLIPQMRANILPGNPYHLQPDVGTILDSWSYYIALIFGQEYTILAHMPRVCGAALGAVLIYSLVRREFAVLFSLAGFVLFLLPASMLPNQREAFYALTPQLFLILLGCLLLERLFAIFSKSERVRWVAAVVVALTLMSWAATFRRSSYFGNRVSFITTVRSVSAVTAAEVTVLVPKLTAKTHLYINNRDQTAWLFAPGPCAYFKVATRGLPISCVMDQPADALRRLYASDQGPKYFLDYKQDGSLTLADASPGPD
jgi:hypothetical protein